MQAKVLFFCKTVEIVSFLLAFCSFFSAKRIKFLMCPQKVFPFIFICVTKLTLSANRLLNDVEKCLFFAVCKCSAANREVVTF